MFHRSGMLKPLGKRPGAYLSAVLIAAVWALAFAVPANAMTTVFTLTEADQTFKVPPGVTSLEIVAVGGTGGDTPYVPPPGAVQGGQPAEVTGTIKVTPGQTLHVEVGGNGGDADGSAEGGFNGGGAGG